MSSELRLEATDEEFSTFLRETCGIETNSFTVRQARNGDDWERRGGPRCVDRVRGTLAHRASAEGAAHGYGCLHPGNRCHRGGNAPQSAASARDPELARRTALGPGWAVSQNTPLDRLDP